MLISISLKQTEELFLNEGPHKNYPHKNKDKKKKKEKQY